MESLPAAVDREAIPTLIRTMNKDIIHSLSLYLRRFRLELIGFWSASLTLSCLLAGGYDGGDYRLKFLELILLTIVVARLALAETIFKTTGGWKSRPLSRNAVGWARFWTFCILVGTPLVIRVVVWWATVRLGISERLEALRDDVCGLLLFVGGFFLLAHLVSRLIERERRGLALFVVFPFAMAGALAWLWTNADVRQGMAGGSFMGYGVTPGVRAVFPPDAAFIGSSSGAAMDGWAVQEVLRVPLKAGATRISNGEGAITIDSLVTDNRLMVDLIEDFPHENGKMEFPRRLYVVRYSDGSISGEVEGRAEHMSFKALLYRSHKDTRTTSFRSPRDYPWNERSWDQLLAGAELILFRITDTPLDQLVEKPELRVKETLGETRVRSALVTLHVENAIKPKLDDGRIDGIVASKDDVVELLLRWPVWSDAAFEKLVLPVFGKRVEERHRTALQHRFKSDVRLAGFLLEKGWGEAVMPELIRRLKDGIPLRSQELVMIAGLKDATLADALVEAFLRLPGKNEAFAAALQNHPGVNWPAVVRRGWELAKTGNPLFTQWWVFANWAARDGDISALRRMAVEAANGKKWEREQLVEIVDSGGEDPVSWLARNHGVMRYDPATKRFAAGR